MTPALKRLLLLGPILFAVVLAALTILDYEFLRSLGWHPIQDPTFDWPSGLALGRFGWIMTATFIISGILMAMLGLRLLLDLKPAPAARAGSILMVCAGAALAMLSFTTDPTIRDTPATWHGRLHDLSFVLLGLTLFPAMIVLGFAFRADPRWRDLSLYTWGTLLLAAPAFALKGAAFYVFLLAILIWNEVVAIRLNRI